MKVKQNQNQNSEVEGIVNSLVGDALKSYLEENPSIAKTVIEKQLMLQLQEKPQEKPEGTHEKKVCFRNVGSPWKNGRLPRKRSSSL